MAGSKCRKLDKEEQAVSQVTRVVTQFMKCLLIIGSILVLVFIRKSLQNNMSVGMIIAYILLACLAMVCIFLADQFAYNNLLIGVGAYFGFELLRLS